jgi:transcriptional regulator with XRE-family HTH domain
MATSVKALVKPELLVWARTSAHLRVEEAAHKAQVKEEQLAAWERGEGQPSIPQLRKLGRVYKRPLAVFYLPKPPTTFQALHDFRRLPEGAAGEQSPELAYEIRRARYPPPPSPAPASLAQVPQFQKAGRVLSMT